MTMKIDASAINGLFNRAPNKAKKAINDSLRQSALIVQNRAKISAPYKTGNLRRSITHKIDNGVTAKVGTDVVYARVREYNTKRLPNGYLRPALNDSQKEIVEIFEKNISNALK